MHEIVKKRCELVNRIDELYNRMHTHAAISGILGIPAYLIGETLRMLGYHHTIRNPEKHSVKLLHHVDEFSFLDRYL
ncbi:MAG: hypothetical protein ACRC3H_24370 [Lachnospiraceae bacterium]